MISVEVDTATLAVTSVVSAGLAYGMCWSIGMKPISSAIVAFSIGIALFAIGIIPIGFLALFGIATLIAVGKKLIATLSSNVNTQANPVKTRQPPQAERSEEKPLPNNTEIDLANDEQFLSSVKMAVMVLEPQAVFIRASVSGFPLAAQDAFSLGYLYGICTAVIGATGLTGDIRNLLLIHFAIKSVYEVENPEPVMNELHSRIMENDPQFLQGRQTGFKDFRNSAEKRFIVLPMAWAKHLGALPTL